MALFGAQDRSRTIVFSHRTLAEARAVLLPLGIGAWLLRESATEQGFLTCDRCVMNRKTKEGKISSLRFALVETQTGEKKQWEWVVANNETVIQAARNAGIVYMNTSEAEATQEKSEAFQRLLELLQNQYGCTLDRAHRPISRVDQSRQEIYIPDGEVGYIEAHAQKHRGHLSKRVKKMAIAIADTKLEEEECPITQMPIKGPAMITPTGHVYDAQALTNWIEQAGTDPMTRELLHGDNVLITHGLEKKRKAVETMQQLLGQEDGCPLSKKTNLSMSHSE